MIFEAEFVQVPDMRKPQKTRRERPHAYRRRVAVNDVALPARDLPCNLEGILKQIQGGPDLQEQGGLPPGHPHRK